MTKSHSTAIDIDILSNDKSNRLQNWCQEVRETLSDSDWTKFISETTDSGRLKLLHGNDNINSCVSRLTELYPTGKDRPEALRLKEAGNATFGVGEYQRACELYTQGLVWIPHDDLSPDTSVLYANRSAGLFHLSEFQLSQQDAALALSFKYPHQLRYKLYERVAKCWEKLGDGEGVNFWIQKAHQALQGSGLKEAQIKRLRESYEKLASHCKDTLSDCLDSKSDRFLKPGGISQSFGTKPLVPKVVGGGGKYLKNATKRLTLKYEEGQGRFVVANEKLIPGDVILVEKAYVSALLPQYYHRQCFQCYVGLKAPIPCQQCIYASFCSKQCRDEAWSKHHQFECKILGLLKHSGISPSCYMALRMLTQSEPNQVLEWHKTALATENDPNRLETSPDSLITSTSRRRKRKGTINKNPSANPKTFEPCQLSNFHHQVYKTDHEAILHLCTHPKLRKPEDSIIQVLAALYLLQALKATSYFSTLAQLGQNYSKSDIDIKFGLILLRCLQSLPYNAHALDCEPLPISSSVVSSTSRVEYACGLFPTLSLFNHSCYPSIVRYMVRDTVVVRAIRNIAPGEQVTENYGQHFMTTPKEERQKYLLENYCFQCNCPPCQNNWPVFESLSKELVLRYRCEFCSSYVCKSFEGLLSSCPSCSKPLEIIKSLKSTMERHDEAVKLVNQGDLEKGLQALLENISMLDTFVMSPMSDLHVYQEQARTFFSTFGNSLSTLPVWDLL